MRRLFLAATAVVSFAVPASLVGAAVSAGPAGAATPPSCKKLSGSVSANTFTISKCKPKSKTNKTASGQASALESGSGTITWSPSGGTTTVSLTFNQATTNKCTGGSTEYIVAGTVTGGTSTYTASGQSIGAEVCVAADLSFSLLKKTKMTL